MPEPSTDGLGNDVELGTLNRSAPIKRRDSLRTVETKLTAVRPLASVIRQLKMRARVRVLGGSESETAAHGRYALSVFNSTINSTDLVTVFIQTNQGAHIP